MTDNWVELRMYHLVADMPQLGEIFETLSTSSGRGNRRRHKVTLATNYHLVEQVPPCLAAISTSTIPSNLPTTLLALMQFHETRNHHENL